MRAGPAARSQRIDALRGMAVFGILLVNVWSFVAGGTALHYGVLAHPAPLADRLAVWLVAGFAELKFYPIFAFLFGAGFALQSRALTRACGSWQAAAQVYRRRLGWLLACGMLHGLFIWYGDVLTAYAVCGCWLLWATGGRPLRSVLRTTRVVAVVFIAMLALALVPMLGIDAHDAAAIKANVSDWANALAAYTRGSVLDIARMRGMNYVTNLGLSLFVLPQMALLFLAGVLSVRLGWLTRPRRHLRLWRRVAIAGLAIGLPFNLLWAWNAAGTAVDPFAPPAGSVVLPLLMFAGGPLLAAGYVACAMLAGDGAARRLAALFAPVGRMALTNYLGQSIIGTVALQGFGFGLGARLAPAQLLLFCAGVMAFQLALSRWWLAHHSQGPVEALWRRHTYRGAAPAFD